MKECGICYETKMEKVLPCGHSTCHECHDQLIGDNCPFCRKPFRESTNPPSSFENELINDIEYWLDYDRRQWTVFSRFNRFGTETIRVYRNDQIPSTWRNSSSVHIVKTRRFRRRRFRRN